MFALLISSLNVENSLSRLFCESIELNLFGQDASCSLMPLLPVLIARPLARSYARAALADLAVRADLADHAALDACCA